MRDLILFLFLFIVSFENVGQDFQSLLDSAVQSREKSIVIFGQAKKQIKSTNDSLLFLAAKTRRSFVDLVSDSTLYYGDRYLASPQVGKIPIQAMLVCRWISRTYINLGTYEQSLVYAQRGLAWAEKAGDINAIAYQLADIAVIYHDFKDYSKGVEYGKRCLTTAVEGGADSKYKAYCLNAIGINFDDWEKPDSALAYHFKVLELQPAPDSLDIKFTYNNIGNTLMKIRQYDQAEKYLMAALYLALKNNDYYGLAGANTNLGQLKTKQKQFVKANVFFDSAIHYALKSNSLEKIRDTYFDLYTFYKERGDLLQAIYFQDKFYILRDSIFKTDRMKTVGELEAKYQTSLKDKQILEQVTELKEREDKFNRVLLVTVFLFVLIGMLIIILLLNKSRFKRKQELLEKETEIELQEASMQAALTSQELERKRFAKDLHDGMGQLISSLRLLLCNIESDSSMESRVNVVSKSEKIIDEMQKEIRGIAFNLMPQTLIQHGLVPALKEMGLRITSSGKVVVSVGAFETPDRFSELQEISIYRAVQEWTNNVLKYARATAIEIQLVGHGEELNVTVEDNGQGFDVALLENAKGNGWKNILSRINLLHGEVQVDSNMGRFGTILIIKIPLEPVDVKAHESVGDQNTQ